MGKENGRGKSRRRNISQARKFLNREGKKLCSAALCVSLLFGSVLNTTVAANKDTDDDGYEFELSRASLYQALQDAVLNGDTVDEDMEFRGSAAEEYSEMFAPSGSLYELKPEIEDNDGKVQLRVFAKLDQDIDLDSEYEAAGTEEIMFLLTNRSDEAQKAVIYMDDKYTEEIEVAPGKAIAVQEDETSQGPAGGGAGNGGGSSGGGSVAGGETPADTETTGPADEGGQAPDNGGAPTESQPEETTGTEDKDDATTPDGATDPAEGDDNVTDGNGETGDSATSDNDNSTSVEDGNNENSGNGGDTENTGDPNTDSDNAGNENQSGGQTGAGEGGSENAGDTGNGGGATENSDGGNSSTGGDSTTSGGSGSSDTGNSSSDSSDSGNDGSDSGTTTAAISFHKASWVAAPVATDSDMPVATDSDLATNSDLEKLIDGELYEAVRLRENGAVAFVTTLDDLGVMDGWGPIVFGQKFEADCGNFHVRAIARKGALDNAYMEVTSIDPETNPEEYEKAAQSLAEAGKQYEGMAALDITFRDKDTKEEVEPWSDSENPADWPVYVTIEFLENALPEDIDLDTVEVQHLKETKVEGSQEEVQIDVEEVADAGGNTDGIVAPANLVDAELVEVSEKAEAVAVFSVESFSTFTITWSSGWYDSKSLDFTLIDIDTGETIPGYDEFKYEDSLNSNESITISERIAPHIPGYKYLRAEAVTVTMWGESSNPVVFEKIKATYTSGWKDGWSIEYYNETNKNWSELKRNQKVQLVYQKEGEIPPEEIPVQELSHRKYANQHKVNGEPDGTYDLTLSFAGQIGSETNPALLDVVYVLDVSGSMKRNMNDNSGDKNERLIAARNAINEFTTELVALKENGIDAQFSLVTFSGSTDYVPYNDASIKLKWTDDAISLSRTLNNINNPNGGTNYQAGLMKAEELLEDARNGSHKVVIFVSDGQPGYYYTDWGFTTGSGSEFNKTALENACNAAERLKCNYFYTIGVGPKKVDDEEMYSRLEDLANRAPEGASHGFYTGDSINNLTAAFEKIHGDILYKACGNVVITDYLSQYVEPVLDATGKPIITIEILNKDGDVVGTSANGTLKWDNNKYTFESDYVSSTKQLTLDLDSDSDYTLEKDYTYQVTMRIKPSEIAYDEYGKTGYPHEGEADTGDHSEEKGFYSNANNAVVSYTYDGKSEELEYDMPVVQLTVGNLVIEKKVEGLTGDNTALRQLQNNLKFEVVKKGETTPVRTIYYKEFDAKGKYTVSGLVPGIYTVKESGSTIDGYECTATTSPTTPEVTVTKGGTTNITFTNRYTKLYSLIVKKLLDGDMTVPSDEFTFKATVNNKLYKVDGITDENGEFTLIGGETKTLDGLKSGDRVVIEETKGKGYKTSITVNGTQNTHSADSETGDNKKYDTGEDGITQDTTVTFTNRKDSHDIPLTGIFTDKLPYLLMFSIAMICTAGAMFNSSVRRRHGRDEE